ncbi:ATP-binding cassette domain-containing protein [Parafrankia sp. Ea1.12]|uniref:ATP-binding cassette domain-containing protein n=1 Tax=unclassified Parafrankia TaxID=2994368 RepID=UPI000DD39451|nr:ATP-binding cassette domain-containing protein [Parafrankia sp. Ea1.12]TCJ34027.1 ATP-binding cassette domain-containing protein [Parafrankia sp. BMG5.11]
MVITRGLRRSFPAHGRTVDAVRGVDLRVPAGEVFAFLGPNGAGKTTTLRMLLPIGGGQALVAGIDVAQDPAGVRRRIGYVGQVGGADLPATGRENLLLQGQLYGARRPEVVRRAGELIETFALADFVDRRVGTYSGGQRRRLEVALGLMHRPELFFLDEPTTGLDPQNRANLWEQLRALRAAGTTIFVTTHYLDEADELADRIAIIDGGRIVAEGSPAQLKRGLAGDTVVLRLRPGPVPLDRLAAELNDLRCVKETRIDGDTVRLAVVDGTRTLPLLLDVLRSRGTAPETLSLSEASLDDVFLARTGRALRDAGAGAEHSTESRSVA